MNIKCSLQLTSPLNNDIVKKSKLGLIIPKVISNFNYRITDDFKIAKKSLFAGIYLRWAA